VVRPWPDRRLRPCEDGAIFIVAGRAHHRGMTDARRPHPGLLSLLYDGRATREAPRPLDGLTVLLSPSCCLSACCRPTGCCRCLSNTSDSSCIYTRLQTGDSIAVKSKVKVNGVLQFATRLTATGTHMPYGITQYYLPPGRGDIPALKRKNVQIKKR